MVYIFFWFVIFGLIYKKKLINNKELELTTKFDILFFYLWQPYWIESAILNYENCHQITWTLVFMII